MQLQCLTLIWKASMRRVTQQGPQRCCQQQGREKGLQSPGSQHCAHQSQDLERIWPRERPTTGWVGQQATKTALFPLHSPSILLILHHTKSLPAHGRQKRKWRQAKIKKKIIIGNSTIKDFRCNISHLYYVYVFYKNGAILLHSLTD